MPLFRVCFTIFITLDHWSTLRFSIVFLHTTLLFKIVNLLSKHNVLFVVTLILVKMVQFKAETHFKVGSLVQNKRKTNQENATRSCKNTEST